MFSVHHTTLSVSDLSKTIEFYSHFGFKQVHIWKAKDNSLQIIHLKLNNFILEIFHYTKHKNLREKQEVGNNLETVGVKHLALRVSDIRESYKHVKSLMPGVLTDIVHGRTGIDYFFVQDPDGLWLEIVQDDRSL